jgi:tRNA pseudouridine38-40 synthase
VRTVAGVIEAALAQLYGDPIKITGAGRTDRGVHASGQVVSFSAERAFPVGRLALTLNSLLPADCSVREAAEVEAAFSARFSARTRTYVYAILNRPQRDALLARYACHVARPLDVAAMRTAGNRLIGEHDFRAFSAASPEDDPTATVRTVERLTVEPRGELIRVEIAANAFLRHMVRIVVGTLLECGSGRWPPEEPSEILAAGDRPFGGRTAPARGLYLAGVRYEDGYDSFSEPFPFGGDAPALLDGGQAFP